MSDAITRHSKFLSYILRHHPEEIGLEIDSQGWAHLPSLLAKAKDHGRDLDRQTIHRIINSGGKQRFRISDDGTYIRAGYGHSIDVELDLDPKCPPVVLFHGTATDNVESILSTGLHPQNRQMVHLSEQQSDALEVGSRHGKPRLLVIRAEDIYEEGHAFYQSDSEASIWLVEEVPPHFIEETAEG